MLNKDECPSRRVYGIPEGKFVFCCFNQLFKIDPEIFAVWMSILKRTPNSVLWLLRFPGLAEANLRAEAKAHGIDDKKRLFFSDVVPREEHLCRVYLADLFLDTPVFNARSSAADALWGGTPIVTLAVEQVVSRTCASMLTAAGLPDLITTSLEEYEELAVKLGKDHQRLHEITQQLESTRETCPLFDVAAWVRNFEAGLVTAWERHEKGMEPDHINVRKGEDEEAKSEAKEESRKPLLRVSQ